ncbi:MAG: hypothetical protein GQ574_14210 [Crocinitomix sp.]|nr:hypothetical protein [Crocinitomix sp.]
MKNKIGPPVEGDDFYGRRDEIEFVWQQILEGNNLLFPAPRRVGKTSFAKKLLEKAKSNEWDTLEINLEGISSEKQFVKSFLGEIQKLSIWTKMKSSVGKTLRKLIPNLSSTAELSGVKVEINWLGERELIFDELKVLLDHSEDTLIMVDELGVLLNNYTIQSEGDIADAEYLLNWFRSLRQVSNTKIRWIFCSSVGIKNFTNKYNISHTVNDLTQYELKIFERKEAKEIILMLTKTKKIEIGEGIIDHMLDKLGWYLPYFVQLFFSQINRLNKIEGMPINKEIIEIAYVKLIEGQSLDTWDERLVHYGEYEKSARIILCHLCQNKKGLKRKRLFDLIFQLDADEEKANRDLAQIIRMLTNDGYLFRNESSKYAFRSPFLRDYWNIKFIK